MLDNKNTRGNRRLRLPFMRQPSGIIIAQIIIFILIIGLGILTVWRLFIAGESTVSIITAFTTVVGLFVTLALYSLKQIRLTLPLMLQRWLPLALLIIIFIALLFGQFFVFDQLGKQQYERAIRANSLTEAQSAVNSAQLLGMNVNFHIKEDLQNALTNLNISDDRVYSLAQLMTYVQAVDTSVLEKIREFIDLGYQNQNLSQMQRGTQVLAILNRRSAQSLADEFNDAGVKAMQNGDNLSASLYLETVAALDEYDIGRDSFSRSISVLNLGYLRERTSSVASTLDAYFQAWEISSSQNYEAAYAYSSLTLIQLENDISLDPNIKSNAKSIATVAVSQLNCESYPITADESQLNQNDICFRLMTTLAGIELKLGNQSKGTETLVERSIRIAEVTNHFGLSPFPIWTGEAYYYSLLLNDSPTISTLCNIILRSNPASDRPDLWLKAAAAAFSETYNIETVGSDVCSNG